ncbi:rSAM-modified peptide [Flavobacterium sp. SH_e]|nr:rSAM-modified peptide [Flavobacterium sp. SH_e]MCV2485887.1 rSAM-modified peptide [Flavobacterium sp. SH_e]
MKNTTLTLGDFKVETLSKEAQKTIKGGGNDTNNPVKGSGNGSGVINP